MMVQVQLTKLFNSISMVIKPTSQWLAGIMIQTSMGHCGQKEYVKRAASRCHA